jgi:hypothetical protein
VCTRPPEDFNQRRRDCVRRREVSNVALGTKLLPRSLVEVEAWSTPNASTMSLVTRLWPRACCRSRHTPHATNESVLDLFVPLLLLLFDPACSFIHLASPYRPFSFSFPSLPLAPLRPDAMFSRATSLIRPTASARAPLVSRRYASHGPSYHPPSGYLFGERVSVVGSVSSAPKRDGEGRDQVMGGWLLLTMDSL